MSVLAVRLSQTFIPRGALRPRFEAPNLTERLLEIEPVRIPPIMGAQIARSSDRSIVIPRYEGKPCSGCDRSRRFLLVEDDDDIRG